MRVVLDTNIFISALLIPLSPTAKLLTFWREGKFHLLTATPQLDELIRVTRYPKIRARLTVSLAGRLVNELRELTIIIDKLPKVDVSPDPYDNYLLAIAQSGQADYLITGDKKDLLALKKHGKTTITSVSRFLTMIEN
jgi:hypothetical protein